MLWYQLLVICGLRPHITYTIICAWGTDNAQYSCCATILLLVILLRKITVISYPLRRGFRIELLMLQRSINNGYY